MSADNFMAILKKDDKYVGYHCSASLHYPLRKCYSCIGTKYFEVASIEKAIIKSENFGYLEYGYRFIDFSLHKDMKGIDCNKCFQNPTLPEEGSKEAKELGCTCIKHENGFFTMGRNCPVHYSLEFRRSLGLEEDE